MAIVWWDLDGVHALWDDAVDDIARETGAVEHGFPLKGERTQFAFYKDSTPEVQDVIMQVMNHPDLYRRIKGDPKVKAAFQATEDAGHTNRFASSPWTGNKTCMQDKEDFIAAEFGEPVRKHLVLLHDKTVLRGDAIVDDKPKLSGLFEDDLEMVHIVPTQPYNAEVETPFRINDWEEDLPLFLRILDNIQVFKAAARAERYMQRGLPAYA